MTYIKAPYNFVPLNKKVVSPYWEPYISHDVPFEDSESGELEITITAASPIFVKNGMGKDDEKAHYDGDGKQIKPYRFSQDENGNFFIPGSSVKGMIRSVLEVMSFGHMGRKINDIRYSVRDFSNSDIYNPSEISREVKCGWLRQNGDRFELEGGGPVRRIKHVEIEKAFRIKNFSNTGKDKSAKAKHHKLPEPTPSILFSTFRNKNGVEICTIDSEGDFSGRIVVTGQPSDKKNKEFVFVETGAWEDVPSDVVKNFLFAYYDHDRSQQSEDWKFWKTKLSNGEKIPVFYRRYAHNKEIKDMGLAMLYKIVYRNSILELVEEHQGEVKCDISEVIFGHIKQKDKGNILKGRIHVGHAYSTNMPQAQEGSEFKGVLSSPKATYYPNYIHQAGARKYSTYHDKANLSGWKRYPVHSEGVQVNERPDRSTEKILTRFIPLKEGATFKLKLRYHSLKKIELGALLSALTFHNTERTFHSIGMAKPLGYGKVKIELSGIENIPEYMKAFECFMNVELENTHPEWHLSSQVRELLTMSQEQDNSGAAALEYMKLGMKRGEPNEFVEAKKSMEYLKRYSELVNNQAFITPLSTPECIQEMKKSCAKEQQQLKALRSASEIYKDHLDQAESELRYALEQKKKELLQHLYDAKKATQEREEEERKKLEAELREQKKAKKQEQAKKEGLAARLEDIDLEDRNAFKIVISEVESFCEAYYTKKIKDLKKEFPQGFLPEQDQADLLEGIQVIRGNVQGSEARQWAKPYKKNARLKKLAEWIGEEQVKKIFIPQK